MGFSKMISLVIVSLLLASGPSVDARKQKLDARPGPSFCTASPGKNGICQVQVNACSKPSTAVPTCEDCVCQCITTKPFPLMVIGRKNPRCLASANGDGCDVDISACYPNEKAVPRCKKCSCECLSKKQQQQQQQFIY